MRDFCRNASTVQDIDGAGPIAFRLPTIGPVTTSFTSRISTPKSTGFGREHRIPGSTDSLVVAIEAKAVTSATTMLGWETFKRRQRSRPSIPGHTEVVQSQPITVSVRQLQSARTIAPECATTELSVLLHANCVTWPSWIACSANGLRRRAGRSGLSLVFSESAALRVLASCLRQVGAV